MSHLIQILADPPNRVFHKAFERFARLVKESHLFFLSCQLFIVIFVLVQCSSVCIATFFGDNNTDTKKKLTPDKKYNFFFVVVCEFDIQKKEDMAIHEQSLVLV